MDCNTFFDHNKILILSLFHLQSYNDFLWRLRIVDGNTFSMVKSILMILSKLLNFNYFPFFIFNLTYKINLAAKQRFHRRR